MQLAWFDPQLEGWCTSRSRLHSAAGAHGDAAEDLLFIVSRATRLEELATFRSVLIDVNAGNMTISIEEVDMHARPLSAEGIPHSVDNRSSLTNYSMTQSLLVQDFHIRGQSILRLAS